MTDKIFPVTSPPVETPGRARWRF